MIKKMKSIIKLTKIIPIIMSILFCLYAILGLFGVFSTVLAYLCGTSVLSLLFMYQASHAFNFCNYHRCFIHYLTLCTCINILDYLLVIPIPIIFIIFILMFGITLITSIIYKLNNK